MVYFRSNLEKISVNDNIYGCGQANKIGAMADKPHILNLIDEGGEDEKKKPRRVMNGINKSDERYSRYSYFRSN